MHRDAAFISNAAREPVYHDNVQVIFFIHQMNRKHIHHSDVRSGGEDNVRRIALALFALCEFRSAHQNTSGDKRKQCDVFNGERKHPSRPLRGELLTISIDSGENIFMTHTSAKILTNACSQKTNADSDGSLVNSNQREKRN
ncbi:hypothetical protein EVAR_16340_1 [Eumeta japonica]|uniref:Uncharacterized protein n=1 Tax=Eumeta variegata TaxID=151549 RepID=A0A4C1VI94_EUMVA|nr:hypothetical protein EVAR_16340_1 [Eumeta japonica]